MTTLMSMIGGEETPDAEMLFAPDLTVRGSTTPAPRSASAE